MNKKILVTVLTAAILMISTVGVFAEDPRDEDGAVYTMTNATTGNEVVIFNRDDEGLLTRAGSISTGGTGSGGGLDPLGSQGSLVLSHNQRWLLAVNAGSNEISVFQVLSEGLKLVDKVSSGGVFPVSLTVFHNLVYVLNAGGSPNITGFDLSHRGTLTPLADSTRSLGTGGFAQVGFDPEANMLVVTDKANNKILVYSVDDDGLPGRNPVTSISHGLVPFGFVFDEEGHLLVSEAGSGAVSSYSILPGGALQVISPSVANGQMATCWIAGNERGNVFTTNTASDTISAYSLMVENGQLRLRNATAGVGKSPIDMAITENGRFLYVLDAGNGTVHTFRIERGGLIDLGAVAGGLSIFAQGIAVR